MKRYILQIIILSFICFLFTEKMILDSCVKEIDVKNPLFRSHELNDEVINVLKQKEREERGKEIACYYISRLLPERFSMLNVFKYMDNDRANEYIDLCNSIWNDVQYYPVAENYSDENTTNYVNTWNDARVFGGDRGHEGTDIIAAKDQPGQLPIVSMTDGVVTQKGWLTLGGWRIGILSPSGAYFYYAHMDSYSDIEVGDEVEAGDIIGFMGNSGYGEEGTTGKFVTHLHLGIYVYPDNVETSINPYWILKLAEEKKLFCSY